MNEKMVDSGQRETSATGGQREPDTGKGYWELLSLYALARLSRWYELGAKKYAPRNWEKGVSPNRCFRALLRHAMKYIAGWKDEDHLAAVVWNACAIMHFEQIKNHMPEGFVWDIETRSPDNDPAVLEVRKLYPYKGVVDNDS